MPGSVPRFFRSLLTVFLVLVAGAAAAQPFPSKPIRFIVPFAASSTTDVLARFLGERITTATGQPVIVDNRPGAGGMIAATAVAQAPADGYTVFIGTSTTHGANVSLYRRLTYDPVKDFQPVAALIQGGMVLAVNPSFPAANVQELIALAKKEPGRYKYGAGNSSSRGSAELLKDLAGIDLVHVPYKSLPPALTDLVGNHIDMVFGDGPAVMPLVRSGKLRALGVSTAGKMIGAEEVPTIAEQGIPGFELAGWVAAYVPARTPTEIVERLNALMVQIMRSPEAREQFAKNGFEPIPGTPQDLARLGRDETERWQRIVRAAGIQPE